MPQGYALDRNVSLRTRNTFRVDACAHRLATVQDPDALPALLDDPDLRDLPVLVLGEGSNVLFAAQRFDGLVVQLACSAVRLVVDDAAAAATVHVEAAHGWDGFVDWTLARGLCGLENLALIPGQVGAAPIQNIGAYGVEVGEFITAVHAYDRPTASMVRLSAADCGFGYRDSAFKREPERRVVVAVEFRLPREGPTRLDYAGLREELEAMGGPAPTPRNVAAAVRRIRRRKLPDPAVIGNAGSFFKNPVVGQELASALRERYPAMPNYPAGTPQARKLSAAWLIEQAGWRGFRDGDAGISAQHALVLVNHGTATGAQLLGVARRVADSVEHDFGVRLEPEPRILGAAF
ncbi:MAG TPA: UDP-N-acetylmuramate dehydrogenase [Steroidobacteraceae bacterium]|nr:UDP-N-acetylmuramate dehydrogenase [Steroidobacteraceae bacterium]